MHGHNLVAVYQSLSEAERVRERLIAEGLPAADIRISDRAGGTPATQTTAASEREEPGFFAWLFGDVPDTDRGVYETHLQQNRAALSVRVRNEALHQRALDIMEACHPIELDDRTSTAAVAGTQASTPAGTQAAARTEAGRMEGREQVIPVVKEELAVGKRATERHYRVKTYVIERPVEEQVTLRDERVEIERRPVTGDRPGTMPQQREIDVVERHEQAVAEKRGRTVEEVVVRKEVTERPETVRGTVQETKVEVEKERVGTAEQRRPAPPSPGPTRR